MADWLPEIVPAAASLLAAALADPVTDADDAAYVELTAAADNARAKAEAVSPEELERLAVPKAGREAARNVYEAGVKPGIFSFGLCSAASALWQRPYPFYIYNNTRFIIGRKCKNGN